MLHYISHFNDKVLADWQPKLGGLVNTECRHQLTYLIWQIIECCFIICLKVKRLYLSKRLLKLATVAIAPLNYLISMQ